MWVAEFKMWHAGSAVLEASKRLDAACSTYYLNLVHRKGKDFVSKVFVAGGRQKKEMLEAIKSDSRLSMTHEEGDQVFYEVQSKNLFHAHVFNSEVFFVKPALIKDGYEFWTVASWDKQALLNLKNKIGKLKGKATVALLSIKKAPVNLFVPALFQQLTAKQLEAFNKAVQYGYYTLPRTISLEQLAKKLGVPRTTLREHLRKAESKLLPKLAQDISLEPRISGLK